MIKYPSDIKKSDLNKLNYYGNRGMSLENDLNNTNTYYLEHDIAVIYKKPTPIQVVDTKEGKITKAYFKEPSTTDYNGLYKGKYIDFEAKETFNKTNFPLENIHKHQILHLKNIIKHNGICFLIVKFVKINKVFLLFGRDLMDFIDNNTRKSIPISFFKDKGYQIDYNLKINIDYLKIVDQYGGYKL